MGASVLIVDDDDLLIHSPASSLVQAGFAARIAASAEASIAITTQ